MEIKEMTMNDIEVRSAEIEEELQNENADVETLTAEVEELEARKAQIIEEAEQRKAEIEEVRKTAVEIEDITTARRTGIKQVFGIIDDLLLCSEFHSGNGEITGDAGNAGKFFFRSFHVDLLKVIQDFACRHIGQKIKTGIIWAFCINIWKNIAHIDQSHNDLL